MWLGGTLSAAPQDSLLSLSGAVTRGEIKAVDAAGMLQLADGTAHLLSDLASIQREHKDGSLPAGKSEIVLAGGTRLGVDTVAIRGEQLTATGPLGQIRVPLESMRAIVFRPSIAAAAVAEALQHPSRELDTLIVETENGPHSVLGLVESVGDGKVGGEFDGEARTVALDRVVAIVAADLEWTSPPGTQAVLECRDGSTVQGVWQSLADGVATLVLPAGAPTVQIPWSAVQRVTLVSDRLRWLSDLEPLDVSEQPQVAAALPWKRNQSVGGHRLTLNGPAETPGRGTQEFDRGIGVHAASRLTFAVPEGFNRFAASVGIDVETQGRGDCRLVLKGDGIELWSERIRGGEPLRQVAVDIGGVRELSLIVEPGEMLDLGDHVDWANARFLQIQ